MTTEKQIEANKQNALMGGVKTDEGKLISRMNALKFGFFSKIVNDYDKLESKDFCEEIYEYYQPENTYESQLVEIVLSNLLVYRRICFIENEYIKSELDPTITGSFLEDLGSFMTKEGYKPQIASNSIEVLEKFQKYKTSTLNLIIKTQHELERLTAKRKGYNIPIPGSLDVNISNTQ